MKEPMRSPLGHRFERVTVEAWLRKLGSVCPLSGEPLAMADLELDHELQSKICAWHIQRSLALQTEAAGDHRVQGGEDGMEDGMDSGLYDF